MAPVVALGQHAVEHRGACHAVAHAGRELEVDERADPVGARGDVAAARRGADGLGGAPDLDDASEAIESGKPDCGLLLEVAERVVLEDQNVVILGEPQDAMGDRGRERRAGRVLQAGVGQVKARPVFGENPCERFDFRAGRGHRDRDDFRAARLQEREEVEIAGVVDHDRVARAEQEPADEIERLRAGIGHDHLVGIDQHGAFGQANGEKAAQRGVAQRLVVLAPPERVVARGLAQGALDAEIEHPGVGQPAGAGAEEIGRTRSTPAG